MRIKIGVDVTVHDIGGYDPEDDWSRDSTSGYVTDVTAVITDEPVDSDWYSGPLIKEMDVNVGDRVYAVVVDYESGDTFGRDGGYYQIVDVFDNTEDADALLELTRAYDRGKDKYATKLSYKDKEYYTSWDGYFESTQSIDIWECTVRGSSGKGTGRYSYRKGS